MKLTILMPCLNEAETIAKCINKAKSYIERSGIEAEILISDNGSTDGSQKIATDLGARVVNAPEKGYGAALQYGISQARGKYIIMGDADDSYDFSRLEAFVDGLDKGNDLVMGNRFAGGIEDGAMPWKNRYIGNPMISWIGRLFFKCPVGDFYCGLRGFTKEAYERMNLRMTGMVFALEMVIKANLLNMKIAEVPTTLSRDGRSRAPHLIPWLDGWRSLRFLLLFSPRWLFFYPGIILGLFGLLMYMLVLFKPVNLFGVNFDIRSLLYFQCMATGGLLSCCFGFIIRLFASREGILPDNAASDFIRKKPVLEYGGIAGTVLVLIGVVLAIDLLGVWSSASFGSLADVSHLRELSLSTFSITVGIIVFFMSLVCGFLAFPVKK